MSNNIPRQISSEIIYRLFPKSVNGSILPISDHLTELNIQELQIIRDASNKRKFEFSTGRWCAKQALSNHGIRDPIILSGANREPIWPDGYIGSISHCKDQCGAVIAKTIDIKSLGFDVEGIKELKNNIAKVVCTKPEKQWVAEQESLSYDTLILLIFSIKESVYKCVYQNQRIKLGFKDCSILPDLNKKTAQISFNNRNIEQNIKISFTLTATHVYSSAIYLNRN